MSGEARPVREQSLLGSPTSLWSCFVRVKGLSPPSSPSLSKGEGIGRDCSLAGGRRLPVERKSQTLTHTRGDASCGNCSYQPKA